jgi:hypothetical protein
LVDDLRRVPVAIQWLSPRAETLKALQKLKWISGAQGACVENHSHRQAVCSFLAKG